MGTVEGKGKSVFPYTFDPIITYFFGKIHLFFDFLPKKFFRNFFGYRLLPESR